MGLRIFKNLIGIIILAFLASWFLGFIEMNGATFDIKDAAVTTYWDYDEEDRDPFPIAPMRSRQIYEDGFVGLKPDFKNMLNSYVEGETVIGLSTTFSDGKIINSKGTDFTVCLYPENLTITKTRIKSFHHKYELSDSNIFEFEYTVPYYGRNRYFQTHSVNVNLEVDVHGICSTKYLDYKLKEIYLYYMLDALRQHLHAEEQYLQFSYLDSIDNLMFVKDNFEITKEEFLDLDPASTTDINLLQSRSAVEVYTEDEEVINVFIATSK